MPLTHKQQFKNRHLEESTTDLNSNTADNDATAKAQTEDVLMIYDQMKDYLLQNSKPIQKKKKEKINLNEQKT